MLYQGIIGGGSSPVEPEDLSPVLLWTNPSPTSEFAAQTISLNLTEYVGVIVEFYHGDTHQYVSSRVYVKKTDNFSNKFGGGFVVDAAYAKNILALNNEGIQFDNGSPNNTSCIPYKIYGVKEYVVEPVGDNYTMYPNVSGTPNTRYCEWRISTLVSNFKELTANDIYVSIPTTGFNSNTNNPGQYGIEKTYNSETGVLRIEGNNAACAFFTSNSGNIANIFIKNK